MNSEVEVFSVDQTTAAAVPLVGSVFRQYETRIGIQSEERSICIWGGAAANALLMISGHTRKNYCFHDIEMFDTRCGGLAANHEVLMSIQTGLYQENIPLDLGGLSIVRELRGQSVPSFQAQRIARADGDLEMNNILMEWIPGRTDVTFYAPAGTVSSLTKPNLTIRVKPSSELQSSQRLARRIYRNISKAIRLSLACGTVVGDGFISHTEDLIARYLNCLTLEIGPGRLPEWLAMEEVNNRRSAIEWICVRTISELSKRAVRMLYPGAIICEDLYLRMLSSEAGLLKHPFLQPLISHFDVGDVERCLSRAAIVGYLRELEAYENQSRISERRCLDADSSFPKFQPAIFGPT